jgi:hypothetical protein
MRIGWNARERERERSIIPMYDDVCKKSDIFWEPMYAKNMIYFGNATVHTAW